MVMFNHPQMLFPRENTLFSSVAWFQPGLAKPLCWRVMAGPRTALNAVTSLFLCISMCRGDIHPSPSQARGCMAWDCPPPSQPLRLHSSTHCNDSILQQLKQSTFNAIIWFAFRIFFFQSNFSYIISHYFLFCERKLTLQHRVEEIM